MAKMFYTLEEAAQALGVSEDVIRQYAADHKLQPLRDRDKLMFKREEVDALSGNDGIDLADETDAGDSGLNLIDSGDTDAIDLMTDTPIPGSQRPGDTGEGTGVSVFDAGEVEPADPMAQTQVTNPNVEQDELSLESVGSGSGLLDLTRESDDTSLGADLFDDIYPSSSDSIGGSMGGSSQMDTGIAASGVFDSAMETGISGGTNLESLDATQSTDVAVDELASADAITMSYVADDSDPAGSGLGAGFLLFCLIALVLGILVAVSAINGVPALVTGFMTETPMNYYLVIGGLALGSIIAGVLGMVIGKSTSR